MHLQDILSHQTHLRSLPRKWKLCSQRSKLQLFLLSYQRPCSFFSLSPVKFFDTLWLQPYARGNLWWNVMAFHTCGICSLHLQLYLSFLDFVNFYISSLFFETFSLGISCSHIYQNFNHVSHWEIETCLCSTHSLTLLDFFSMGQPSFHLNLSWC